MNASKYLVTLMFAAVIACSNSGSKDERKDASNTDTLSTVNADGGEAALTDYAKTLPLDKIKLPAGFKIEVFAEVDNARSMAMSPSGVVYVGNRNGDKVYAVKDSDGDNKADKKWVIASGLNMPN